jgi:serine/threonine protein kinase
MSDSFDGYERTYDDENRNQVVAEKIQLIYTNQSTRKRHKITIAWGFNDNTPSCLENDLLLMPDDDAGMEHKKGLVVPLAIKEFDSGLHQVWDTVTGLEFRTENGNLRWTSFEDKEEIIEYVPVESLPLHIPKIDSTQLSGKRYLHGVVSKVKYKGRTCVLKSHIEAMHNDAFKAELDARIKIGNVAHITPMLGVVVQDSKVDGTTNVVGILLKYCEKGDLKRLLKEHPVQRNIKERWAAQIVHGLAAIHDAGLFHGDLKCENIVVDSDDNAQIVDISNGYGRTDGRYLKTDGPMDPRRDIYGFGATLWEILHDGEDPPTGGLAEYRSGNDAASRIIRSCVRQNVSDRPSLATVFGELGGRRKCGCNPGVSAKLRAIWGRFVKYSSAR